MAKILLRSGNLDDFQAVGGGGQAVFDSANQVRETLRLRKQFAVCDSLAIPQLNDEGDRVDWYSPVEGSVVSWNAASAAQRDAALRYLDALQQTVWTLSGNCQQSGKPAQQLFGALLENTLQFPGENHLFLVNDKPVICFWGFVNLNESPRSDAFACLRIAEAAPLIEHLPVDDSPTEPIVAFAQADIPLLYEQESAPSVAPIIHRAATAQGRWRWVLPFAAAIMIAIAATLFWPSAPTPAVAQPTAVISPTWPTLTRKLPLQLASHTEQPAPVKDIVLAPIAKDALVMEPNQLRAGTTRFLNGNWRLLLEMKNAPSLRYQIENNKGTARLVHGDNIICRVPLFSGLHQNGELLIKSRGTARCSDGSRFPMPEISCKANSFDVATCTARYSAEKIVPVTFKKIGA
ncbi:SrfA family protein [Pseudocitrobacter vendiensis]|uniref:SsrAB-activated protein n=1 Tax=Pseudocitrobacter vendiensis TaxID=2488306 RepID=A0ABM9FCR9_9ENTR|nr:SrfA family protein [Pseudocitrobacter vendiensis]CAH6660723.1 SsrAB-activated protein [Pseudocitrobacter vendiensis]